MEAIESVQKQFAIIGIGNFDHTSRTYPFNEKNSMVLLMFLVDLIMNVVYFLDGAASFDDYVNSVFTCSTIIVAATAFAIIIWKMTKIMIFLENLGKCIKHSK